MRPRTLIALAVAALLAASVAPGCAKRQITRGELDRIDAVAAKIAEAEKLDAVDCAPKELATAKAELDHARHELTETHDYKEGLESLAAAEKAADATLAKTKPCWEAKQPPTVTLAASPGTVERGKPATLTWSSTRAQEATIEPGVGRVPAAGSREVTPSVSTEYRITAKGTGGQATATARVDVTAPPEAPPPPPPPPPPPTTFRSIHFDFDKALIRADAKPALQAVADYMRKNPKATVLVEGHCDERGTADYNMALGDRRAHATRKYLINLGIAGNRLTTSSFGEERPEDPGHTEEAWAKNRRAEFVVQ